MDVCGGCGNTLYGGARFYHGPFRADPRCALADPRVAGKRVGGHPCDCLGNPSAVRPDGGGGRYVPRPCRAEMQTILNNPLASPFTLGVSNAASFGAALAIVLGIGIPGVPDQWFVSANAFIFALFSALMLDGITRWTRVATSGVVLFGIAMVFTFNALVSMMQFIATEDTLQGLVFWTMGSLARATWVKLGVMTLAFAILLPLSMSNSWKLTALRLGEDRAVSFGINVRRLRLGTLLRISILTALAVAFVGPIAFIGLVAPHIARMMFGEDHRFYLPASALIGALVLSMASIASKNLIPGVIIPVGIVTSLVGVPFFLSMILRHKGSM